MKIKLFIITIFLMLSSSNFLFASKEKNVSFVVTGNARAEFNLCGWRSNQTGGLSRKSAYINTIRNNNIDPIILDAGDALFAHVRYTMMNLPSVRYKAKSFLEGMEKIGCAAMNIGEFDLSGGYEFLKELEKNSDIPFLSANLVSIESGELAFNPYIIINKNKLKIGVIGVTDYLSIDIKELRKENFLSEGQKYINELRKDVDILVMLVNAKINDRDTILESFKDADYVYLSRTVMNTRTSTNQMDGMPIFYTIGLNGKHLIEVNTTIVDDREPILDISSYENRLTSVVRQLIRLKTTEQGQTVEDKYKDNPIILTQIKNYENQVKELENNINKVVNKSECKVVSLPTSMDYDTEMQNFIDQVLIDAMNQ